jgi:hypothetical protein
VWISGLNDSFYHVHVLDRFLNAGFDVFALDLRRCGRAKVSLTGEETTPALMAHDSYVYRTVTCCMNTITCFALRVAVEVGGVEMS